MPAKTCKSSSKHLPVVYSAVYALWYYWIFGEFGLYTKLLRELQTSHVNILTSDICSVNVQLRVFEDSAINDANSIDGNDNLLTNIVSYASHRNTTHIVDRDVVRLRQFVYKFDCSMLKQYPNTATLRTRMRVDERVDKLYKDSVLSRFGVYHKIVNTSADTVYTPQSVTGIKFYRESFTKKYTYISQLLYIDKIDIALMQHSALSDIIFLRNLYFLQNLAFSKISNGVLLRSLNGCYQVSNVYSLYVAIRGETPNLRFYSKHLDSILTTDSDAVEHEAHSAYAVSKLATNFAAYLNKPLEAPYNSARRLLDSATIYSQSLTGNFSELIVDTNPYSFLWYINRCLYKYADVSKLPIKRDFYKNSVAYINYDRYAEYAKVDNDITSSDHEVLYLGRSLDYQHHKNLVYFTNGSYVVKVDSTILSEFGDVGYKTRILEDS